ncbi:MAG: LuxR C-terminal-related transcriptional regulator [Burkholderiales bacterium]|nr:LuxR C-terminal-related transcriptional regulator [Burkholderiales bacterium]
MDALRFPTAKIQPPRLRLSRVPRTQLDAAIARAVSACRVVLLQAPAGFSKTTALAAQLTPQGDGAASAWVSLDDDDDAERLFACLVAALEPHDLPWRTSPEALIALAGSGHGLKRAVAELLNALADSGVSRGLIVLDDLHRVESGSVFTLLDTLIERLPPRWTLLLSSRTPPPLALARLRASGDLAEFNQDDLRFSRSEADALFAGEALAHAAERTGDLFERTAGWPAGLGLALVALRTRGGAAPGGGSAGSSRLIDRHLFDYLAAEVLDDMPAPLHDFLLRTAVLRELTASRAAAVSGDGRAAEWLDEIERRGLFATALDAQERTLVLHDLFRDALLARQAVRLPGEGPELLRRAAAGEADALRRIGYLLRAGEWAMAESALDVAAHELLLHGGGGEVLRLVEQFPAAQHSARLCRLAATTCGLRWEWIEMARWSEQGVRLATAAGDTRELQRAQATLTQALYPLDRNAEVDVLVEALRGDGVVPDARLLGLMADCSQCYRRGEHELLTARYAELLGLLEDCDSLLLWWQCVPVTNWTTIGGMSALIDRYLAGVLPRIGDRPLPMRGETRMLRAFQALWAGRIDAALADLGEAEEDLKWLAVSGELAWSVDTFQMFCAAMCGNAGEVQARLEKKLASYDEAPEDQRRFWRHQTAIYGVRMNGTLGSDPVDLRRWAAMIRENPIENPTSWNPRAWAVRARYAAAMGHWDEAAEQFKLLLPKLHEMDVMGQRTDLTLRAGHVLLRLGRLQEAAAVVAPVMDRLIDEGVRGQALMCGPAVLQELAAANWGTRLGGAQQGELQAAAQLSASLQVRSPRAEQGSGDELLSQREREVLERIAAGDSNKLIARALDISPHTVKRHVANILDKLALSSRGQAAAWHNSH